MLIAANNLKRIITAMDDPPFVDTFYDIVEWRAHPFLTLLLLGLHTYTCLFAPAWQFPILFATLVSIVGAATAARRNFSKTTQVRI